MGTFARVISVSERKGRDARLLPFLSLSVGMLSTQNFCVFSSDRASSLVEMLNSLLDVV
jgi:hypothetical protein